MTIVSARPLRAWSAGRRERVAEAVRAVALGWRTAWALDAGEAPSDDAAVRCEPADGAAAASVDPSSWQPSPSANAGLWWTWGSAGASAGSTPGAAAARRALTRALLGEPVTIERAGAMATAGTTSLASELAERAWEDWWGRMDRALGPPPTQGAGEAVAAALRRWSGAVAVDLAWCGQRMLVLVSGDRAARIPGGAATPARRPASAAGLAPVSQAISGHAAHLVVETRRFELDLGALASLRPGDVLRTTHPIDEPLRLSLRSPGPGRSPLAAAFLGRSGAARAVEVLGPTFNPTSKGDTP